MAVIVPVLVITIATPLVSLSMARPVEVFWIVPLLLMLTVPAVPVTATAVVPLPEASVAPLLTVPVSPDVTVLGVISVPELTVNVVACAIGPAKMACSARTSGKGRNCGVFMAVS